MCTSNGTHKASSPPQATQLTLRRSPLIQSLKRPFHELLDHWKKARDPSSSKQQHPPHDNPLSQVNTKTGKETTHEPKKLILPSRVLHIVVEGPSAMKLPWCRPEFSQGKCLGAQLNTTSLSLLLVSPLLLASVLLPSTL